MTSRGFGTPAVITIKAEGALAREQEDVSIVGSYVTRSEYSDHVAWKGYQVNQSYYMEPRAIRLYENYEQVAPVPLSGLSSDDKIALENLSTYVKQSMISFIQGTQDIEEDATWSAYVQRLYALGLHDLLSKAQTEYEE